jgi:transposase
MPWVDSEVMSIFLSYTSQQFPDDLCVMLFDGAGWHRAHALRVPKNMVFVPLPPYSPELNPVEHIWDYLRDALGNTTLNSLEEVVDLLCGNINTLLHQPDMVCSMTCFDWITTLCLISN